MKKIRLCIGTNDGETIADTHMGDTEYFHIYDLFENSDNEFIEKRRNTAKDMGHAKVAKMKAVIGIVMDADILVAKQKSPNFIKIAKGTKYQPVVVSAVSITDIPGELYQAFNEIYSLVRRRKNGETFESIPVIQELNHQ
jgi:predicted Fe-Mo cluster-binding NifX family protein